MSDPKPDGAADSGDTKASRAAVSQQGEDGDAPERGGITATAEDRVQDALIWLDLEMTGER